MFRKKKPKSLEEAYAVAADEWDEGKAPKGLRAMAEAEGYGDSGRSRSVYIHKRAAQLVGAEPPPIPAPPPVEGRPSSEGFPKEAKKGGCGLPAVLALLALLALLASAM